MSQVVLRPFIPDEDSGFIFSSYPKGVYYGSYEETKVPKKDWFANFFAKVKEQLTTSRIIIACLQDSRSTIIGYSIISGTRLEFVYVKEDYRKQGVATLLTKNKFGSFNEEHLTNIGYKILEEHPDMKKEMLDATKKR